MAEEPEEEAPAQQKDQGGPGRYFVLVLLVLLLEGAIGYWIIDQAVPAPELPAEEVEEEEVEEEKPWVAPIYFEDFEDLVVEPTAFRGNRMVQLSLVLEVDATAVSDELAIRKDQIWDLMLRQMERMNEADFRDPKKTKLKGELIRALNDMLKNPGVTNIFVTKQIMQ